MRNIYSKKFKLIISIGYPKTGTTYLQNFFFLALLKHVRIYPFIIYKL